MEIKAYNSAQPSFGKKWEFAADGAHRMANAFIDEPEVAERIIRTVKGLPDVDVFVSHLAIEVKPTKYFNEMGKFIRSQMNLRDEERIQRLSDELVKHTPVEKREIISAKLEFLGAEQTAKAAQEEINRLSQKYVLLENRLKNLAEA